MPFNNKVKIVKATNAKENPLDEVAKIKDSPFNVYRELEILGRKF